VLICAWPWRTFAMPLAFGVANPNWGDDNAFDHISRRPKSLGDVIEESDQEQQQASAHGETHSTARQSRPRRENQPAEAPRHRPRSATARRKEMGLRDNPPRSKSVPSRRHQASSQQSIYLDARAAHRGSSQERTARQISSSRFSQLDGL